MTLMCTFNRLQLTSIELLLMNTKICIFQGICIPSSTMHKRFQALRKSNIRILTHQLKVTNLIHFKTIWTLPQSVTFHLLEMHMHPSHGQCNKCRITHTDCNPITAPRTKIRTGQKLGDEKKKREPAMIFGWIDTSGWYRSGLFSPVFS